MIRCSTQLSAAVVLLLALVQLSCKQEELPCLTAKTAALFIQSRHRATDTSTIFTDTNLTRAVFIAVDAASNKNGFLYGGPQASFGPLSLSPLSTSCQYAFRADSTGMANDTTGHPFDTLTFNYRRDRQFLSNVCGYTYFFTLESVATTHAMIDSVAIINPSVTNNVNTAKHVQIFIHPAF